MDRKPWVEASLDVFELSLEQYRMSLNAETDRDANRYSRVSLINADDAAELSMKGFIEFSCNEKEKGNFFENFRWIRDECKTIDNLRLKKIEGKIRYYHKQRDTLYHQGYSLTISRLELLDCLTQISTLFELLFPVELQNLQQYNLRGTFLRQFIDLETIIVALCEKNDVECTDDFEMSEVGANLLTKKVIDDDMLGSINEISEFTEALIPKPLVAEISSETYEVVQKLSECLNKLKKILQ